MSFALNSDDCYCATCDLYFSSLEQRAEHIQESSVHPECDYCKRRYLNKNTLRNHYIYSKHHHYCASCDVEFQTPSGLRYHIEHAPVHCDDSDDEEEYHTHVGSHRGKSGQMTLTEWEDEMGLSTYPEECESGAHSDDESDDSWEVYDDYDYEDPEDPEDLAPRDEVFFLLIWIPLQESGNESEDEEEGADDEGDTVPQFSCPMCQTTLTRWLARRAATFFALRACITGVFKTTHACPVCYEAGTVEQLRKIFLA
ncbi:hypothetical protein B0H12DRAFT_1202347 [Mycena haematopus]|nr:hypothetical protein B0H12DRAFT_1202347 [Mycena haematopus]